MDPPSSASPGSRPGPVPVPGSSAEESGRVRWAASRWFSTLTMRVPEPYPMRWPMSTENRATMCAGRFPAAWGRLQSPPVTREGRSDHVTSSGDAVHDVPPLPRQPLDDARLSLGSATIDDLFPEGVAFRRSVQTFHVLLALAARI